MQCLLQGFVLLCCNVVKISYQSHFCVQGNVRCGDESAQCISSSLICDDINHCLNGWDEEIDRCVSSEVQAKFAETSNRATQHYSRNSSISLCEVLHVVLIHILGELIFLQVGVLLSTLCVHLAGQQLDIFHRMEHITKKDLVVLLKRELQWKIRVCLLLSLPVLTAIFPNSSCKHHFLSIQHTCWVF